ncbi:SCO-spondin-like [Anopheles marshallii]|uniref:SCO-spondin-like n=1 Tax=Anopheles marshallii TaxID=1521116 RepID=UPI00237C13A3|nr:SCO-spondin-like [Anopheles marshallii]
MKPASMIASLIVLILSLQNVLCACPYPHPYPSYVCGSNEEYQECGTACPKTCMDREVLICTMQCVQGCFCKPGFIRESKNGKCIPECQCIKRTCFKQRNIIPHLSRIVTSSIKPSTTINTVTMKPASMIASLIVLILSLQNVLCACPYPHPYPSYVCGSNEEYQECGTACPKTCMDREVLICTKQCVQGCFCKPGFIRESKNGKCIPECQCPYYMSMK